MADSNYLNTSQYWADSYWGGVYWGVINIVPFDYAEIWDGAVIVNMAIAGSVMLNLEVNANVIMNQEIQQTNYSELESTL